MFKKFFPWLIFSFFILFVVLLFSYFYFYKNTDNNSEIVSLKHQIRTGNKEEFFDWNNDNIKERFLLKDYSLIIYAEEKNIWQSNTEWHVDDFILGDSNNDQKIELNLLVWKSGNFGSSQPFWEEQNDLSIKNHFFVYQIKDNNVKALWQSSNLDRPNCSAEIYDVDNDNENELVALEGEYRQPYQCEPKFRAIWKWEEWGFYNNNRENY